MENHDFSKQEFIFLADLTHTGSKSYSPNLIPYPIGCIKSYFLSHSHFFANFKIELFKDPQNFIDSFFKKRPSVIGFSNYVWGSELAYTLAKEIKSIHPDILIIFGGPNFPLENDSRKNWLIEHPAVDIYVVGEGEQAFTEIIDIWNDSRDIESVKKSKISGCFSIVNENLCHLDESSARINDLDQIPSPYLEGFLDEFLKNSKLSPLLESNRGCPFSCTFCVDGIKTRSKVFNKSVSRFYNELEYIAQHYNGKMLTLADLNFGMYGRDLEISKSIAEIKRKYQYPYYIQVSAGKNNKARILECAEILEGSMGLAASVQSLDKEVLTNVKRNNISEQQLLEMTQIGNKLSANTYSEVILALPGDTKEKHFETVLKLADAEIKLISMYQCMVLEGSELGANFTKNAWGMKSKFRVLPRCFGVYDFNGKEIRCAEIEKVCVSNSTLSIEDYYECRQFALSIGLFYQDRVFYELYQFLKHFDILPSDILPILFERRMTFSKKISELFDSFDTDTRTELWDDKEDLRNHIQEPLTIEKYAKGELGINVLFKHRAIAALDLIDEIHDAVFRVASELIQKKDLNTYENYKPFLKELKTFSILRKRNVFDFNKKYSYEFHYDFETLEKNDFKPLPQKSSKLTKITFYSSDEQKSLIQEKIVENGSDVNGIGKILSKMLGSLSLRTLSFDGNFSHDDRIFDDMGIMTSPGEFV
ncbi:B12-binding domain-containing radical SAM protein [Nitrosopumilus sp. S6]